MSLNNYMRQVISLCLFIPYKEVIPIPHKKDAEEPAREVSINIYILYHFRNIIYFFILFCSLKRSLIFNIS